MSSSKGCDKGQYKIDNSHLMMWTDMIFQEQCKVYNSEKSMI